jgi:hypothetical protein
MVLQKNTESAVSSKTLTIPELEQSKAAVLNALASVHSRSELRGRTIVDRHGRGGEPETFQMRSVPDNNGAIEGPCGIISA